MCYNAALGSTSYQYFPPPPKKTEYYRFTTGFIDDPFATVFVPEFGFLRFGGLAVALATGMEGMAIGLLVLFEDMVMAVVAIAIVYEL